MENIKDKIRKIVAKYLPDGADFSVASSAGPEFGDACLPCFPLAKLMRKSPDAVAADLKNRLSEDKNIHGIIDKIETKAGYLNFYLRSGFLAAGVIAEILKKKEKYGLGVAGKNKRVMVEYVSPNSNKPLHLGHIRNALLGESVSNLLESQGYKVIRAALVNDRGVHICKSMLAYKLWGKNDSPEKSGIKPDHFVVKYYAMFGERAKQNPELEDEAREMLKLWEAGDRATLALWKKMNAWVYEGWRATYKTLGVKFDTLNFESGVYKKGREIIMREFEKGTFVKDENGNYVAKLNGLPDKVVLRADGTSVYITTDLYLAEERFKKFKLDKLVYVVGAEQDLHFRQLFQIFNLLGFKWAKDAHHLNYGLVLLPEGRLKSREGVKVDADEIANHLTELSREDLKSRYEVLLKEKEIDIRSRAIALAALKFHLLNVSPAAPIHFNPKESLAFSGKTGPYLQYVYARINSILKKAGGLAGGKPDFNLLNTAVDKNILMRLQDFPFVLERAAAEYNPADLTNYLYDLSRDFSDFYESEQILKAPKDVALARIALIRAVQIVLAHGLNLLGIETLKEM